MAINLPRKSYAIGVLPYVLPFVRWLMENVGTNTQWWAAHVQPILEPVLWFVTPAFLFGLLIGDTYNPQSWLRQNWRTWTRKFDVVSINVSYAEEPRRLDVRVQVKFVRSIRSARLRLRVYSCTGIATSPFFYSILIEDLRHVAKDDVRSIQVATMAISHPGWSPFHSSWGPGPPDHARAFVGGSKNVVELELSGILIRQRHQFFVSNPSFGSPPESPVLYVQDEDEDVFATTAIVPAK